MAPRSAATAAACCRHLRRILRPPARRRRLASPRGSRSILPFPPRPCPPLPAPLRSVPAPSSAAEKRRQRREEPLAAYPPPASGCRRHVRGRRAVGTGCGRAPLVLRCQCIGSENLHFPKIVFYYV